MRCLLVFFRILWVNYKNSKLSGSDFSSRLIEVAKKENPNMNFYVNNLLKNKKNIGKFNITTCLGTLHAFDNLNASKKFI